MLDSTTKQQGNVEIEHVALPVMASGIAAAAAAHLLPPHCLLWCHIDMSSLEGVLQQQQQQL
jgi:hypothetical protein